MLPMPRPFGSAGMNVRLRVLHLGEVARSCLEREGEGQVLASLTRALYLTTDAGELFWLASPDVAMHRRCVSLDGPVPRLTAGARYRTERGVLTIAPGWKIETGQALTWRAPSAISVWPAGVPLARILDMLSGLEFGRAPGFGRFIPGIVDVARTGTCVAGPNANDAMLRRAEPLVLRMAHHCLNARISEIAAVANRLIGLGPGLTPSGDDFLGGVLFSIHTVCAVYAENSQPMPCLAIEQYQGRTHPMSFTLLSDLARGHAIAPMHDVINGLMAGDSPDSLRHHVLQLLQVGHSTGSDLLAGLLAGLLFGAARADSNSPTRAICRAEV